MAHAGGAHHTPKVPQRLLDLQDWIDQRASASGPKSCPANRQSSNQLASYDLIRTSTWAADAAEGSFVDESRHYFIKLELPAHGAGRTRAAPSRQGLPSKRAVHRLLSSRMPTLGQSVENPLRLSLLFAGSHGRSERRRVGAEERHTNFPAQASVSLFWQKSFPVIQSRENFYHRVGMTTEPDSRFHP